MADPEVVSKLPLGVKHDWYQSDQAVVINVLVKNIKENQLKISFSTKVVNIHIEGHEFQDYHNEFNLSHNIIPEQSSYKLSSCKVEIKLKKAETLRWDTLEGEPAEHIKQISSGGLEQSGPPTYPTSRKGKDWSQVEKEMKKQEAEEKPEGEEALNKLFQEIYGKGSDEVKKAMNKSFMESGGTVLSTNWSEVSTKKVEVKPPDGVEYKKWNG